MKLKVLLEAEMMVKEFANQVVNSYYSKFHLCTPKPIYCTEAFNRNDIRQTSICWNLETC